MRRDCTLCANCMCESARRVKLANALDVNEKGECSLSPDRLHPGAVDQPPIQRPSGVYLKILRMPPSIEMIRVRYKRPPLFGRLHSIHRDHFVMRRRTNAISHPLNSDEFDRRRYCNARAQIDFSRKAAKNVKTQRPPRFI